MTERDSTNEIATLVRESYAKVASSVAERIAHAALPENGGHVTSCGTCTDAHCCTMLTTISVPEALTLVDALLALPSTGVSSSAPSPTSTPGATPAVSPAWRDLLPALTRAARADCAHGLTSRSRFLARVPCGLLDANRRCTVYASRPGACRLHTAVTPSRNCSPDAPEHADPSTVDAANPLPWSRNIGSHDFLEIEGALWRTHAQISHALEIPPETQGPVSYMYFLRVVVGDDAELNAALAGLPESPLHWMMAHVADLHAENQADAEADSRIADTHEKLYAIGRRVFGDSTKGTP